MVRAALPVTLACAAIFAMFGSIWWVSVIVLVLAGLIVGLLDRENSRLHDELARRAAEQSPDRAPRSSPKPQSGDAFLQGLRQLGKPK